MATRFQAEFDGARVDQMRAMLELSTLPDDGVEPLDDPSMNLGIKLDWLKSAKDKMQEYDVKGLEDSINSFSNFTASIENVKLHFVHERSPRSDATPLLLLHGWSGLFYDFHKVIRPLVDPSDPNEPAFHVVVPSLPGHAWSTLPRQRNFDLEDIARIYNKLMVEVLDHEFYMMQGGDWGSHIMRYLAQSYPHNVRLSLFNMFYMLPEGPNRTIVESEHSEAEVKAWRRHEAHKIDGTGYSALQRTKPATIGYAIGSSPLSLLAYMGEKMLAWTDPKHISLSDILTTVVIYYLTNCAHTSVMIYQQSRAKTEVIVSYALKGKIKSKIGYSLFPYEIEPGLKAWLPEYAPLVQYTVHDHGGHFPALDNPEGVIKDIRSLCSRHWSRD